MFSLWSKKWNPKGRHCYVTGGSTGLGLALSVLLVKAGAHVSIVARNEEKLRNALEILEASRVDKNQIIKSYSFSLTAAESSAAALEAAYALFLCAGASKPKFFVEMTEEEMSQGMDNGYWVQAWTALAATKKMVNENAKGKIVFVSSTLGYMSFHALRGLADTLASELQLYGIDVHIFFATTMRTPGLEEEKKSKPAITSKIEGDDSPVSPESAAERILSGIQKGHVHIGGDFLTDVFRASTRGSAPYHNPSGGRCTWYNRLDRGPYLAMVG
ncbi:hypothetical protein BS47DRAFT_1376318 [Hydnum rufescens UP504]|uniref:NAD(P)-binding protein n=1 Tax=Hydnum rufescens UP504 TaxID=1448309 RepID=A0A9P6B089_9AGAM|nr:hypothetical protein BS47DRAFT_1376318 [Hydnum rufescens UP504]